MMVENDEVNCLNHHFLYDHQHHKEELLGNAIQCNAWCGYVGCQTTWCWTENISLLYSAPCTTITISPFTSFREK